MINTLSFFFEKLCQFSICLNIFNALKFILSTSPKSKFKLLKCDLTQSLPLFLFLRHLKTDAAISDGFLSM